MKNILVIIIVLILVSCQTTDDQYLITSKSVGLISESTTVNELSSLYPNDSIHKLQLDNSLSSVNTKYVLYSKEGDKLLELEPSSSADTSKIAQVEVISPKFKTNKGLNTDSKFKKVYDNYTISSIQKTLVNVIVNLKKEGIYLALDNENLPDDIKYDDEAVVKSTQIPDDAPIKYFWVRLN